MIGCVYNTLLFFFLFFMPYLFLVIPSLVFSRFFQAVSKKKLCYFLREQVLQISKFLFCDLDYFFSSLCGFPIDDSAYYKQ